MMTSFQIKNFRIFSRIFLFFVIILFFLSPYKSFSQFWTPLSSGTNGPVYAVTVYNDYLIIAGDFTQAGGITCNKIAQWTGSNWAPIGLGMDSAVYALSIYGTELIAAGKFINAGGVICNRVARWNGSQWFSLGLGTNAPVYSLTVFSASLRAGGIFTSAGGVSVNRIASWNASTWSSMGLGVNDAVYAMTVFGSDLIIGGRFTIAGFLPCNRVARYTINSLYYPLANGIDSGTVYALQAHNGVVFVGGDYTSIGGISVNNLASWDGTNWNSVGNGMNGAVFSLGEYGSSLIAGGRFTISGSTQSNYISSWNGSNWSALGTGMSGGSPTSVEALSVWSNLLIVGGNFITAGGTTVNNVAAFGNIPGTPTLISPCSITTDTVAPLLDWSDVNYATSYGVQVSDNPNFTDTIIRASNLPISQYRIGPGILSYNTTYFWRANASNGLGTSGWSLICYFTTPNPTGIIKHQEQPKEYYLYQNYPNPFNPNTVIQYQLPKPGNVALNIFNIEGKEITNLYYSKQEAGVYNIEFDGTNFPSGVYFYKLSSGSFIRTKKMILLR